MALSTPLFNALVRWLVPHLTDRATRDYYLDSAFYDEADQVRAVLASDLEPRLYAQRLVRLLDQEWTHTRDGQRSLAAYLAILRPDFAGDAALTDLLGQLRAYEGARALAQQAGLNPDGATLDELVEAYLSELVFDFELTARGYVELGGTAQTLAAASRFRSRRAQRGDPLADLGLVLGHVELDGAHCVADSVATVSVASVRQTLAQIRRGVLLGEPGSGKSWTLRRLALDYIAIARGEQPDPVDGRRTLIPIFVELRDFNGTRMTTQPDGMVTSAPLRFESFMREQAGLLASYLPRLLHEGRLVFLLDALNEMPRLSTDGRDLVAEVRAFLGDKAAFVVSCRVRDYRDDLGPLRAQVPLEQLLLCDLTPPQVREVVVRRLDDGESLWQAMGGSEPLLGFWQKVREKGEETRVPEAGGGVPSYTSGSEDSAWRRMHSGARLIPLCRNPFMAYLVCELYRLGQGQLPASRADLFRQFVQVLLRREAVAAAQRGEAWPRDAAIEAALVRVAGAMQQAGGTVLARAVALGVIAEPDAGRLLDAALAANLLAEEGDAARSVRFSHQLLQEFFAARILLEALEQWERGNVGTGEQGNVGTEEVGGRGEEASSDVQPAGDAGKFFGSEWWDAGVWRETVVILGEFLGEGARGPNRVARWLARVSPEVALGAILRHGAGLTLADVEGATRAALVAGARARTEEPDPRGRTAAYRVLETLGADERPGVGLRGDGLPDIEWVRLEGGTFPIGGDEQSWSSLPAQEVELATFWLAKYPVTNAQWQAFVDDPEGYRVERWWREARVPQETPDSPRWDYGNHPRETVNWYEAMAYCRWLSHKLGYEVRLPTEEEWERGARGRESWVYPWGDEWDAQKANTDAGGIGQTSAVGMYPQGATPAGICDLAGNVWEWTASLWSKREVDITSPRVLRGGSWAYDPLAARAASRFRYYPLNRNRRFGFRLVALAPAR